MASPVCFKGYWPGCNRCWKRGRHPYAIHSLLEADNVLATEEMSGVAIQIMGVLASGQPIILEKGWQNFERSVFD